MTFDEAFVRLLGSEGGFVDHPADPGGATCWGVSERVARANGYTGDMRNLPQTEAKRIAMAEYWTPCRADELPEAVRFDVFDGAYNSGVGQSIKWLQRAVSVTDDGKIGPGTLAAVLSMNPYRVAARYNGHRLAFMKDLKNWGSFSRGWADRIAINLKAA